MRLTVRAIALWIGDIGEHKLDINYPQTGPVGKDKKTKRSSRGPSGIRGQDKVVNLRDILCKGVKVRVGLG